MNRILILALILQCIFQFSTAYKLVEDSSESFYPVRYQYDSKGLNKGLYEGAEDEDEALAAYRALIQGSGDLNEEDDQEDSDFNIVDLLRSTQNDIQADQRDEETESHSSLIAGHQYVSGGAGEGKQHLQPDGNVDNKEEIKSDEDLPAYCDPPNPCPVGYIGEDCDPRPYFEYTAKFSKDYQDQQNCICDDDHNECSKSAKSTDKINDLIQNIQSLQNSKSDSKFSAVVAKKSPRIRREANKEDTNETRFRRNPYLRGQAIKLHVAKKSAPSI